MMNRRMEAPKLESVHFGAQDVIATSFFLSMGTGTTTTGGGADESMFYLNFMENNDLLARYDTTKDQHGNSVDPFDASDIQKYNEKLGQNIVAPDAKSAFGAEDKDALLQALLGERPQGSYEAGQYRWSGSSWVHFSN